VSRAIELDGPLNHWKLAKSLLLLVPLIEHSRVIDVPAAFVIEPEEVNTTSYDTR
jgi:hypothetical protein